MKEAQLPPDWAMKAVFHLFHHERLDGPVSCVARDERPSERRIRHMREFAEIITRVYNEHLAEPAEKDAR